MSYQRVVPRDLFNESKLLKCLGQLVLLIHNGCDKDGTATPANLKYEHVGNQFNIIQDPSDGSIESPNMRFYNNGSFLCFGHPMNCNEPYPLLLKTVDDEIEVFNDDGTLTDQFREFCDEIED